MWLTESARIGKITVLEATAVNVLNNGIRQGHDAVVFGDDVL